MASLLCCCTASVIPSSSALPALCIFCASNNSCICCSDSLHRRSCCSLAWQFEQKLALRHCALQSSVDFVQGCLSLALLVANRTPTGKPHTLQSVGASRRGAHAPFERTLLCSLRIASRRQGSRPLLVPRQLSIVIRQSMNRNPSGPS